MQEEEAATLVDSMIEYNGLELLVYRLTSLAEAASDEEGKAVFNTLSIFENMVEVKPEVIVFALLSTYGTWCDLLHDT